MKKTIISSVIAASIVGVVSYAPTSNAANTSQCVDGNVKSNLVVTWNSSNDVTVTIKDNKALCDKVALYFSSYTMPDNYNGERFSGNPTATPQTEYAHTPFSLQKGTNEPVNVTVDRPEDCKNVQMDVYYAPVQRTVGPTGHDNIVKGIIYPKTVDECQPETPEVPETPETPEVPVPQIPVEDVVETPSEGKVDAAGAGQATAPVVLPSTGAGSLLAVGAITSVLAYAGTLIARKQ